MTDPIQSIQELQDELNAFVGSYTDLHMFANDLIERLEAAESRFADLQQLMAQGHSKARKYELRCNTLRTELYKAQRVVEGLSADFCTSPMAIQALPPVDEVSSLLAERLKKDASRIAELEARLYGTGTTKYDRIEALEAAQRPRPMGEAPTDGSEVLAWCQHLGWEVLAWSNVSDCWTGHTKEWPTHWVYLPEAVDDTYSRGARPLLDQQIGVVK